MSSFTYIATNANEQSGEICDLSKNKLYTYYKLNRVCTAAANGALNYIL